MAEFIPRLLKTLYGSRGPKSSVIGSARYRPGELLITDEEESTPGVVEFKYIQVKPGETLTDVLLRQHICLKVQHNNTVIIQLNNNHKYYFQLYQQMFVTETEYHWGVLIAQGTDGDLFYEKVKFTEEFWSPILKKIELFFDAFLVYELAYPRVQLGLERVAF